MIPSIILNNNNKKNMFMALLCVRKKVTVQCWTMHDIIWSDIIIIKLLFVLYSPKQLYYNILVKNVMYNCTSIGSMEYHLYCSQGIIMLYVPTAQYNSVQVRSCRPRLRLMSFCQNVLILIYCMYCRIKQILGNIRWERISET